MLFVSGHTVCISTGSDNSMVERTPDISVDIISVPFLVGRSNVSFNNDGVVWWYV